MANVVAPFFPFDSQQQILTFVLKGNGTLINSSRCVSASGAGHEKRKNTRESCWDSGLF